MEKREFAPRSSGDNRDGGYSNDRRPDSGGRRDFSSKGRSSYGRQRGGGRGGYSNQ